MNPKKNSPNVDAFGLTHPGFVRPHNEDAWGQIPEDRFYIVADGMGGHQAGEIAATMAVDLLSSDMKAAFKADPNRNLSVREYADLLADSIRHVNERIFTRGSTNVELNGMGTTLCALFVHPEGIVFGHVGDSRIYRFRHGHLSLLTKDHSLLREMLDQGRIEEEKADEFVYRNIITKAIGTDPHIEPSVQIDRYEEGDIYLLCSDGLSDFLTKDEILTVLLGSSSLNETVDRLIHGANEKGGSDNITVVLVETGPHEQIS